MTREGNSPLPVALTHREIAEIFCNRGDPITEGGVFMAEQSALKKMRKDPELREFFDDLGRLLRRR